MNYQEKFNITGRPVEFYKVPTHISITSFTRLGYRLISSHKVSVQRYTCQEHNGWTVWRSHDERSRNLTYEDPENTVYLVNHPPKKKLPTPTFLTNAFLARGLGVKVKGRVEKQDCNEQWVQKGTQAGDLLSNVR